jgi:hypothetical protein
MPKTSVIVDRTRLEKTIKSIESGGNVKNLSLLWIAVADLYNESLPLDDHISSQTVSSRVKEWKINILTQSKKGRASVEVDEDLFKKSVEEAEKDGPLANRTLLWAKVAEIYNNILPASPITPSIVYLRVGSLGLTLKTEKGKRGNGNLTGANRPVGRSRRSKFEKSPIARQSIAAMRQMLINNDAERYMPLVDRIARGSMKAAVRLNCLQCVAFNPREVGLCGCVECPFFAFRPKVNETPEGTAEIEIEIPDEIL